MRRTIGLILDEFQKAKINIPAGMTKEAYLEYKLNEAIVESKGLDLLTMGKGEGPECYCYPNLILRKFVDSLASNYAYVVMDNEAGMEHLSRRTTQNVNVLLLVSNHSVKGVRTIGRIRELVDKLQLEVEQQLAVVNMVPNKLDPLVSKELGKLDIALAATIPEDEELYQYDLELKSLLDLPDTSRAVRAVDELMDRILERA